MQVKQVKQHGTCTCRVTHSFSTASNAMWAEWGLQQPEPACPSRLYTKLSLSVDCGACDFSFQPPIHLAPSTGPPWGMRSEATKNSPRLGLHDMFPFDEVALHSQHRVVCIIPHRSTKDWMTPSVTRSRTAQQRILAEEVERQNGQTPALPLSSLYTPPSHPSPLMQVMPFAGLPNFLLRASPGSSELVRRHHMVPVAQEAQV